ncbi:RagB/SusD family nutrient uptake outer membrane protein [Pedobacter panaciterrae]|uniref:RagB/SusD family nutrient uptake outer membrane protein n=1 Tax=Pedobacter panaciterrae TaxID=363849 RepID=UPI00155DBCCE|nr:RagB/SusD family nutrient uptake outer membrane protein [Pedobacter panaciterrae]NQX55830.1 RagB/SusD family nutrient uptake outer membrane protein [Pedobacter panaciterrae]
MKNNIKIYTLGVISCLLLFGCKKNLLDRYPLDQITDENYWKTENDLKLYANSLYPKYIVGFGTDFADGTVQPYGVNVNTLVYGDVITDNAAPLTYSKVGTDEYIAYLSGGSGSGGWNFEGVRQLNFFIDNYKRASLPDNIANKYLGEIYFFKAWDYFNKVKLFGDVSWLQHSLNINSPELFGARTPRAEVMDSVMVILNMAIDYLPAKGTEETNRLNKDMALFLKSRIGLFEGTYRKYHTELGLDANTFLRYSAEASEALLNKYSLVQGDYNTVYNSLFATESYKSNPEVIMWREYSAAVTYGAAFSRYFAQNLRHQFGATRSLVDEYLCADGLTISTSPLFKGKGSIQTEMENRDPRLTQTIANFGTYNLANTTIQGANNAPLPNLPGMNGNKCPTGYRLAKWFYNNPVDWERVTNGQQAAPVFRFAEVLLNYAEAKYELGEVNQLVIDQTINKLRDRVGMPHLTIGNEPADSRLDGIYQTYVGASIPPLLREIRRERRVEMAFENTRWDDLMRWKAGKLINVPVEGIKFVQSQFPTVVVNKDIYLSAEGYILPYFKTIPAGRKFDETKGYLFPIPTEDLILNKNLVQNPNWK